MGKQKKSRGKDLSRLQSRNKVRSGIIEQIVLSLRIHHLTCMILRSSKIPANAINVNFALRSLSPCDSELKYFFQSDVKKASRMMMWDKLAVPGMSSRIILTVFYQLEEDSENAYRVLLEYSINLASLYFVSDDLDQTISLLKTSRKSNTLILCLKNLYFSVHTASCGDSVYRFDLPPVTSYNFSSFQRLLTTSRALLQMRRKQHHYQLRVHESAHLAKAESNRLEELVCLINLRRSQLNRQRALFSSAQECLNSIKVKNSDSTKNLESLRSSVMAAEDEIRRMFSACRMERLNLENTTECLRNRRQLMLSQLCATFTIGEEKILELPLPNSKKLEARLPSSEESLLAASYGYTALVTEIVSALLCCPLRHSITFCGSKSKIKDDIIQDFNDSNFPLYPKGRERSYFLRAVFLLNLNIYGLWCNVGLVTAKPPNLRETSTNLRELLNFLCGNPSSNVILPTSGKSREDFAIEPHDDISPCKIQVLNSNTDNLSNLSEESDIPCSVDEVVEYSPINEALTDK